MYNKGCKKPLIWGYNGAMHLKHYILFAILGFAVLFFLLPMGTEDTPVTSLKTEIIAHLPDPASNNAVAIATLDGDVYLFSFSGLGMGKTRADIHARAYAVNVTEQWARDLPSLPGGKYRLASVAATAGNTIYLFGGYTVAGDGDEVSTPEVFAYNPTQRTYTEMSPMPTPVDDSVALVYQDRYIYLVSGWHDSGNVADVQVFDTAEDRWFAATPYPGPPVFGHAGGIVAGQILIADGVRVLDGVEGAARFAASDAVYLGTIDENDPAEIDWQAIQPHPGNPLYRMAATGFPPGNLVVFAGGSANPYNYNGIGYDGVPSRPSASVFGYDLREGTWRLYGEKLYATMDHRGLLEVNGRFYTLGGMVQDQEISDVVSWFELTGGEKNE